MAPMGTSLSPGAPKLSTELVLWALGQDSKHTLFLQTSAQQPQERGLVTCGEGAGAARPAHLWLHFKASARPVCPSAATANSPVPRGSGETSCRLGNCGTIRMCLVFVQGPWHKPLTPWELLSDGGVFVVHNKSWSHLSLRYCGDLEGPTASGWPAAGHQVVGGVCSPTPTPGRLGPSSSSLEFHELQQRAWGSAPGGPDQASPAPSQ